MNPIKVNLCSCMTSFNIPVTKEDILVLNTVTPVSNKRLDSTVE